MQHEWVAAFTETARRYWTESRTRDLVGDRHPAILPGQAPVLLRALGLLYRDGSMPREKIRKYRQINHMLAVMQPSLRTLRDRHAVVRIMDAACGRSYLSTLIAWYFREHWSHPVQILGVDQKPALIEESWNLRLKCGREPRQLFCIRAGAHRVAVGESAGWRRRERESVRDKSSRTPVGSCFVNKLIR